MRILAASLCVFVLASCSRDPNVVKVKYLQNGNKYFERGRYKEASIMYRNALAKDRMYGPAYYKLAQTEMKLGQIPQAVRDLRRAMELIKPPAPDHWDAGVKLADIYLAVSREKQHLDEADTIAKNLLERDPNSFDGHRLIGDLSFIGAQEAFKAQNRDRGNELLKTAVMEYRKADAAKPGQTGVRLALARVLSASGDYAGAEALYQGLIAKDAHQTLAYNELYQLYLWQKKLDEAEKTLKLALANNPKRYGLMTMLAAHYFGLKRHDDGVRVLQKLKASAADFPQAYLVTGDFYLRLGDGDQAHQGIPRGPGQRRFAQAGLPEAHHRSAHAPGEEVRSRRDQRGHPEGRSQGRRCARAGGLHAARQGRSGAGHRRTARRGELRARATSWRASTWARPHDAGRVGAGPPAVRPSHQTAGGLRAGQGWRWRSCTSCAVNSTGRCKRWTRS